MLVFEMFTMFEDRKIQTQQQRILHFRKGIISGVPLNKYYLKNKCL